MHIGVRASFVYFIAVKIRSCIVRRLLNIWSSLVLKIRVKFPQWLPLSKHAVEVTRKRFILETDLPVSKNDTTAMCDYFPYGFFLREVLRRYDAVSFMATG